MANSYWTCEEDFENDLYELSDITSSRMPKLAPAPSKFMIKLRGKASIYDDVEEEDDEIVPECIPVRGYPLQSKNNMKTPGGVPSFVNNDTTRSIREVSGFGYSNDLIEHTLRDSGGDGQTLKMPNLTFRATNGSPKLFKAIGKDSGESSPINLSPKRSTPSPIVTGPVNNVINIRNRQEFPDLR